MAVRELTCTNNYMNIYFLHSYQINALFGDQLTRRVFLVTRCKYRSFDTRGVNTARELERKKVHRLGNSDVTLYYLLTISYAQAVSPNANSV